MVDGAGVGGSPQQSVGFTRKEQHGGMGIGRVSGCMEAVVEIGKRAWRPGPNTTQRRPVHALAL
jgi:hypothetical protein